MRANRFFIFLIILFSLTTRGATIRAAPFRRPSGRKRFILSAGQNRIDTGISFIQPGSDSLIIDGVPADSEEDYRINSLRGVIILDTPAKGGEIVTLYYNRYYFPFPPVMVRRSSSAAELPYAPEKRDTAGLLVRKKVNPYRFNVSASKSVGFSVGSARGLGIDQSLKVTIAGKLAEDLEVKAFLSDDNLPVQPEGNTEELKRLDRISINIRSRHTEVKLADFTSFMRWSKFSSFERDFRGGEITVNAAGQSFMVGGGVAKGRFETININGREGVQGPYQLLSARRFNGVIVIPGSETVYLDGGVMKRGRENDYIIDYSRGSVTFTERVPITDDSEIVVEFQKGESNYERNALMGGWSAPFYDGRVNLKAFVFTESDDKDAPLTGDFTDEEISALAAAGDNPDSAFASGVSEIDHGGSGYIYSEADSYYVFVESEAEYELDFYETPGTGSYDTDGFSADGELRYRFVGEGKGDYRIGNPLPLPQRKDVVMVSADATADHLFISAEGDFSRHDRNTMSGRDDDDNNGSAYNLEVGIRNLEFLRSTFDLRGRYSSVERTFTSPDRVRRAYFYRNWNLEGVELKGRENISNLRMNWEREGVWKLEGGYSRLSRDWGLTADKVRAEGEIGNMDRRGARFEWLATENSDRRKRRFALAEGVLAIWKLVPRLSFDRERYRNFTPAGADTGRYYRRGKVSLSTGSTGSFSAGLSFSRRLTDNLADNGERWFRARENDEIILQTAYSGISRMIDFFVSHREKKEVEFGASSTYDLARVRYRDSFRPLGVTTDMNYRITSGEERRRERAVIYVGENQGDYDEEGNEVGQKRGDYMVVYIPGGETEGVRSVELNWKLSFGEGIRGLSTGGDEGTGFLGMIRKNISLDQIFSLSEKSTTNQLFRLYTMDPSLLQRDDVTVTGFNRFRQEWNFLRDVKKYNLGFIFSREDREDNRTEGASSSSYLRELKLKSEYLPASSFSISLQGGRNDRENLSANSAVQSYDIISYSLSSILGYRRGPNARFSVEFAGETREDGLSESSQNSYSFKPSANLSPADDINIRTFYKLTYTDVDSDSGQPLFFLEEGVRQDWNIYGRYQVGKHISVGLNYTGRREKDFREEVKTVHALKVESRAYF